jgi:hypothetical protein
VSRPKTSSLLHAVLAAMAALLLVASPALAQTGDTSSEGGASVGTGDAGGGSGGDANVVVNPVARTGDSGTASASSSATNTGNTGDATSFAVSNPVATSGQTGGTAQTAPATGSSSPASQTGTGTSGGGGGGSGSGTATSGGGGGGSAGSTDASAIAPAPAPADPGLAGAVVSDGAATAAGAASAGIDVSSLVAAVQASVDDAAADADTGGSPIGFNRPLPRSGDAGTTLALLALAAVLALRVRSVGARPARA